ncbi:hypothetical protein EDE08_11910 [Bradyrhizobium sp. R2.2-H]|jgi:hypothetical protein|uniref:hypothetical protein n=1 Tax=unclassified Bradyrhizobium TaxID=2631580 RepID=UPI0010460DD2|nr:MULTISPECIES: hypothetical protein [unclassified Bradyrhizobium]TCU63300.1 hypothetical protein EDE10_119132 [Bradyrhizobium sp. Y-H1]TCU65226.1 hypothetical protein EDE08_11910 [Bradyrhizobium sp. R2.2-H]
MERTCGTFLSTVATTLTASSALARSEGEFPAKLAGHVVMPAGSFIDAPIDLEAPGKYTTGKQVDALVTGDVYQWGALMAGSLLGSLPAAIFYSLFVDYYVSSLTGAVKRIARRAAP